MEELKQKIEQLNNLYFKLIGMYHGCLDCVRNEGIKGRDFEYFESILDFDYLGLYLEMLDDAIVEMIGHSLECDSYEYTVVKDEFEKTEIKEICGKAQRFFTTFISELNQIKDSVGLINLNFNFFDEVSLEMERLSEVIYRGLFHAVNSPNLQRMLDLTEMDK